ncbi:MAG: AEC family transporter [Chloroflexi bacterium]|nr:MAG: AEC family transporter [Chloroflexota bacterium]
MDSIVDVLVQNLLPIFIVAAFGYGLQRWTKIDKKSLSSAVLYVFSPCLVFSSLVSSQLPGSELTELALFAVLNVALMGSLAFVMSRLMRLTRAETAALMIVVMFVNGGNYGLTLNQLRYGDAGLSRAVVYYTTSTMITYTIGIFIASMGKLSWRDTLKRLSKLPPVYAAVLAVVVYTMNITVPEPLMKGITVAGGGAIPVLLVVLGMQLADLRGNSSLRLALPAVSIRLLLGPLLGLLVASLLGLSGLGRSTSIVEASMPTAVFTIILATEFDLHPTAVTSIVVLTTLLSPITVATAITVFGL